MMTIEETIKAMMDRLDEQLALMEIGVQNLHEGLQEVHQGMQELDKEINNCRAVINVHNS